MTTTYRRESAPNAAEVERIVVGPTLIDARNSPTARKPRANVLFVLPDEGAAMLGSATSPRDLVAVIERGVYRRPPEAIWLRDVPWFVDRWGARSTGRLERSLSEIAAGRGLTFVSWLEGITSSRATRVSEQAELGDSGVAPPHVQ